MMDCGGDGGALEDFVELATDIADSSRTIRDAAERLLTLLGVDDENDDLLSSSEDEGVEVDVEDEEDEDRPENTRLLHQLAASLAQELKYSQQKHDPGPTRIIAQGRGNFDERDQNVEMVQDDSFHGQSPFRNQIDLKTSDSQFHGDPFVQNQFAPTRRYSFGYSFQGHSNDLDVFETKESLKTSNRHHYRHYHHHHHHHHHHHRRRRHRHHHHHQQQQQQQQQQQHRSKMNDEQEERSILHRDHVSGSWGSGWDACATEALRYLVEDEGLPAHHPTVLAMKNHLELQRGRVFAQNAVFIVNSKWNTLISALSDGSKRTGAANTLLIKRRLEEEFNRLAYLIIKRE
ncbi:hypothetical protein HZH68_000628 [Vespula germanica]|uniref:Uncharacterized protein n=1 Tax=Vespula germanica TaxID=30212 RepID=A0A834U673_VESGE|nr:hypothetical protein HZH68_000628 [Vespula germanica]